MCHARPFDGDAVLHSLFKAELHIQPFIDRVVPAHAPAVVGARIVPTLKGVLNAVAEEVEGVLPTGRCSSPTAWQRNCFGNQLYQK